MADALAVSYRRDNFIGHHRFAHSSQLWRPDIVRQAPRLTHLYAMHHCWVTVYLSKQAVSHLFAENLVEFMGIDRGYVDRAPFIRGSQCAGS